MPHSYSSQYREMVLTVVDVATELEVSEATVFRWRRQDRIDRRGRLGSRPRIGGVSLGAGTHSGARNRTRCDAFASELFGEGRVVHPKLSTRSLRSSAWRLTA